MARIVTSLASLTLCLSFASAHPGHGGVTSEPVNSWTHYATEPLHVIPVLLVVGGCVACVAYARRNAERQEVKIG